MTDKMKAIRDTEAVEYLKENVPYIADESNSYFTSYDKSLTMRAYRDGFDAAHDLIMKQVEPLVKALERILGGVRPGVDTPCELGPSDIEEISTKALEAFRKDVGDD